jgi:hypothetical protein
VHYMHMPSYYFAANTDLDKTILLINMSYILYESVTLAFLLSELFFPVP